MLLLPIVTDIIFNCMLPSLVSDIAMGSAL